MPIRKASRPQNLASLKLTKQYLFSRLAKKIKKAKSPNKKSPKKKKSSSRGR